MDDGEEWEIDAEALGGEYEGVSQGVPLPLMRAVYAKRRLTVLVARPDLLDEGTVGGMNFAARTEAGVSIIELGETEVDGFGWELTVGFLADGNRAAAERALATWATRVGYRRVWLPDGLYEPAPTPPVRAIAAVNCPTCGHRWHGRGRRFWRGVWAIRLFHNVCPLCGGILPQWGVRVPAAISARM